MYSAVIVVLAVITVSTVITALAVSVALIVEAVVAAVAVVEAVAVEVAVAEAAVAAAEEDRIYFVNKYSKPLHKDVGAYSDRHKGQIAIHRMVVMYFAR